MAKLFVIAIRDSAADVFAPPRFVPHIGSAVRAFGDEVQNKDGFMFRHPGDYTLHRLGMFDDGTGKFDLEDVSLIARAVDYVKD